MKYILSLLLVVSLASCQIGTMRKYRIESDGSRHYTDNYTKSSDGCITFQTNCNCSSDELRTITICGTYTITELNK